MNSAYRFVIHNNKVKQYQWLAYCIIAINMVTLGYLNFNTGGRYPVLFILVCIAGLCGIIFRDHIAYKKHHVPRPVGLFIVVFAVLWMQKGYMVPVLLDIVLWALYTISRRPLEITISTAGISYPSFPKKMISWNALQNVVMKDGLLTIDQRNNKVYQHYIPDDVNEQEFNEFCEEQLQGPET